MNSAQIALTTVVTAMVALAVPPARAGLDQAAEDLGEVRDHVQFVELPASETTPDALARRFADGLPLPGMPDLDRPVYVRAGSVICTSPGALRNPHPALTVMVGACAVIEAEGVRVMVYEPRDADSYVDAHFSQSVRVAIYPRRIAAADSIEGWVDLRSISND